MFDYRLVCGETTSQPPLYLVFQLNWRSFLSKAAPVNFCPHQQTESTDLLFYSAIISVLDLRGRERRDGGECRRVNASVEAEGSGDIGAWPLRSAIRMSSSIFIDRCGSCPRRPAEESCRGHTLHKKGREAGRARTMLGTIREQNKSKETFTWRVEPRWLPGLRGAHHAFKAHNIKHTKGTLEESLRHARPGRINKTCARWVEMTGQDGCCDKHIQHFHQLPDVWAAATI